MHEKLQNEISNSKSNRMEKHEHVFVIIQLLCASQGNKRREWKQKAATEMAGNLRKIILFI